VPSRSSRRRRGCWTLALSVLAAALVAQSALAAPQGGGNSAVAAGVTSIRAGAEPASGVGTGAGLPPAWSVQARAEGRFLVWTTEHPLPFGGARIEVLAGDRPLGAARVDPDLHRLEVALPADLEPAAAGVGGGLRTLQVVAAGRRLDAGPTSLAAQAQAQASAGVPAEVQPRSGATTASPRTASAVLAQRAATLPLGAVDPGRRGPYRTTEGSYRLASVPYPGLRSPLEVQGVVVSPVGATGRRPLVVLIHGRHATCYQGGPRGTTSNGWPCPRGELPIPSHRGFLATQRLLASQGYITVSVAANAVNGQDNALVDGGAQARAAVLRHHLTLWHGWATSAGRRQAPATVRAAPLPDLRRVVLVGHSRGGEGANRLALDSTVPAGSPTTARPPWTVAGVLHLAPLAYGMNPAPGVPVVVMLPSCDGDIADLHGQLYVDGLRDLTTDPVLRSSVLVVGANHNYFNAEWTPGTAVSRATDDWFDARDPVCGTGRSTSRLTAAQQRAVGATYAAAAARAFVTRDPKVVPLLDGSRVRAASAGPARVLTHALGANRTRFIAPGHSAPGQVTPRIAATGGVTARLCAREDPRGSAVTCRGVMPDGWVHPHFSARMSLLENEPSMRAVHLAWRRATGTARITPRAAVSLAGSTSVALRVVAPPGSRGTRATVRLSDARGRTATLGDLVLDGTARSATGGAFWAQEVRLPLSRARGLDLRRVASLTVVPRSATGRLLLLDAWGHRPGLSTARPAVLPRMDVGTVRGPEGDTGTSTLTLRVALSGPALTRPASVHVVLDDSRTETTPPGDSGSIVTIAPRSRFIDVPIQVQGNTIDDRDGYSMRVLVRGLTGVTAGTWTGAADIVDDEPTPRVTITPAATTVTEGQAITWNVALAEASAVGVGGFLRITAPAGGARELSTNDVPRDFLSNLGIVPPLQAVPLSALPRSGYVLWHVRPGETSATFSVPTVTDTRAEGTEHLALTVVDDIDGTPQPVPPGLEAGQTFTATVTDP